ncbi:uncharacterized protein LOC128558146 [Mercenaria mercenaria]|uniref:uncharacterized protein LOC128558146 n=1 Tax=Mercenaria mercenaria TaxID=6596 RepID=UPI00234EFEFE|nr:uncharacterized protein LOC128558146 [Mercenaria mercenaria]
MEKKTTQTRNHLMKGDLQLYSHNNGKNNRPDDEQTHTADSLAKTSDEETTNSPKRKYKLWTKEDTKTIKNYFSKYILSTENLSSNKGNLPGQQFTYFTGHKQLMILLQLISDLYQYSSWFFKM